MGYAANGNAAEAGVQPRHALNTAGPRGRATYEQVGALAGFLGPVLVRPTVPLAVLVLRERRDP